MIARVLIFASLWIAGPSWAEPSIAAHRRAVQSNTDGMRLYQSGQLVRAADRFNDAIASDPGYALPRYNLACVDSRLRDVKPAIAQLAWLSQSKDPIARARLDKAARDPDLDFISVFPEVRRLLQLMPFDPAAWRDWLTERSGNWSSEQGGATCERRSYTLKFDATGAVSLRIDESCAGKPPSVRTFAGRYQGDEAITLTVPAPGWPDSTELTLASCPRLSAPGSCFTLSDGTRHIGPFHRGAPGLSPLGGAPLLGAN